jgi:transposase-like protein
VDQFRQVVDAYGSRRPDGVAARRFFDHALGSTGVRPAEVTADKAPAYLRVRAAFDQLALAI